MTAAEAAACPEPQARGSIRMRWLENRVPPPVVTLVIAAAMGAAAYCGPPSPIAWRWRAAAAAILFVAAGMLGPPALRAFRRAKTSRDPVRIGRASSLVTTGVYARTRNPMYLAIALLLTSWAAWLGHW